MLYSEFLMQVKIFEGYRAKKYKCASGVESVGYGFTASCFPNGIVPDYMDKENADALLELIVNETKTKVERQLQDFGYLYTTNQLWALTDFAYNCGMGNLRKLCATGQRTMIEIGKCIRLYNKSNGTVLQGLVKRREWEEELFFTQGNIQPTKQPTVTDIQNLLNNRYGYQLKVDGIIGNKTISAIYESLFK